MTTTRTLQAQQTRQAVLDTARRLFAERGYDATSLQEIADAMGVRKANVYYYFKTKSALLAELLGSFTAPLDALLDEVAALPDRRSRVERLAVGYAAVVTQAYRGRGPLNHGDPGLQREPGAARIIDELAERGLRLLFGDAPSVDQRAAFWLILDLGPVLRRFDELSDADLRAALERLCLRVVRSV